MWSKRGKSSYSVPETSRTPANIAYVRDFLPVDQHRVVVHECQKLRSKLKKELNTVASKRLGVFVPRNSAVVRLLLNQKVSTQLSKKLQVTVTPGDFPVEYRVYPPGAHMSWHKDEALYVEPQYELIYTVSNTSDSYTEWKDECHQRFQEWTEPNSLLVVRAEGFYHRVSPVTRGERGIIKLMYASCEEKLPAFDSYLKRTAY